MSTNSWTGMQDIVHFKNEVLDKAIAGINFKWHLSKRSQSQTMQSDALEN